MHRPSRVPVRRVATVAVVAVCLGYAPIAMTDVWPYAWSGAPAIGQWLLARTVSAHYVSDAFATRVGPYRHSLVPLLVHSVLGGLLMLLGPVQLLTAVRRRIRLHRATGVVFALTVYASMAGAAIYLARTKPADAFSGPAFWITLATILVGTVLSATFGILAVLTRFPDLHQRWLLLCYGYLMTAPLLRLEWTALPWVVPGLSLTQVNQLAIMHLGLVVCLGALLASRALDRRETVPGVHGSWAPWPVLAVAQLTGAGALAWIVRTYLPWGAGGHRLLLAYLLPLLAAYLVLLLRQRAAGRQGHGWAREEWRLHLVALCLSPAYSAGAALFLEHSLHLDRRTAFTAGLGIGGGMLAFAATAVVSLRVMYGRELRKRERLAATARPRPAASPAPAPAPALSVTHPREQTS
ncbi:DUF2306 domain-containing protein [Kitasatospora sp. LaBMicrA B282]|uniref:DUF2306 domain-containing protein n=1 Tax=Kitasatospora sp. LaBMicrA B282 TaxID=3420949 RepID=UPI003D13BDF2